MMFPKYKYFRSKSYLKNVASLPCQNCYIEGETQAAHSNQSIHGKAKSLKASDEFVAALCQKCHYEVDQGKDLSKQARMDLWEFAYKNTLEALKKI